MTPPDAGPTMPTPDPAVMRDYIDRLTRFYIDNSAWVALAEEARGYIGALDRRSPGEREAALERENEDLKEMMRGIATQLNAAAGTKIPAFLAKAKP